MEVFEIKAMINERLTSMKNEIDDEIENTDNPNPFKSRDVLSDKYIDQYFGDIYKEVYDKMNEKFEELSRSRIVKSLAYNSPNHLNILEFRNATDKTRNYIREYLKKKLRDNI